MKPAGKGKFSAALEGPQVKGKEGMQPALLPVTLEVLDETSATLTIGNQKVQLSLGKWSPDHRAQVPGGICLHRARHHAGDPDGTQRAGQPVLRAAADPSAALAVALCHAASLVKDAWKVSGGFLTLGWPQDTNALEDGCISDEQFISLCDSIFTSRKKIFFHQLDHFREGVLAGIFDCLDRVQHMFMRSNPDVVQQWYLQAGRLRGRSAVAY